MKVLLLLIFVGQVALYLEAMTCLLTSAGAGSATGLGVAVLLYLAANFMGECNRYLSQYLRRIF